MALNKEWYIYKACALVLNPFPLSTEREDVTWTVLLSLGLFSGVMGLRSLHNKN
jgi:hypothetical protein